MGPWPPPGFDPVLFQIFIWAEILAPIVLIAVIAFILYRCFLEPRA